MFFYHYAMLAMLYTIYTIHINPMISYPSSHFHHPNSIYTHLVRISRHVLRLELSTRVFGTIIEDRSSRRKVRTATKTNKTREQLIGNQPSDITQQLTVNNSVQEA